MIINDTIINVTKNCLELNFFNLLSINVLLVQGGQYITDQFQSPAIPKRCIISCSAVTIVSWTCDKIIIQNCQNTSSKQFVDNDDLTQITLPVSSGHQRSPDSIAVGFFLRGYLKSKAHVDKRKPIEQLKYAIREAAANITFETCEDVTKNTTDNADFVQRPKADIFLIS